MQVSLGVDSRWGKAGYYAPISLSLFNNGGAYTNYDNSSTIVNENTLNYTRNFDNHNIDVVGGFTYQTYKFENLNSGTFSNFQSDIYQYNNLNAAGIKPSNTNTGFSDNKLVSYLGILSALEQWMKSEYPSVTPESPIGKAIAYSLRRWEKLSFYVTDGKLEIDNNLVENAIRPVALGYV